MKRIMLLAAAVLAVPTLAWAADGQLFHFKQDVPVSGSISCSDGTNISFSGTEHDEMHAVFGRNYTVHIDQHMNFRNVTGKDQNGVSYVINLSENMNVNATVGVEETFVVHANFNSVGKPPNYYFRLNVHMKVNADGTQTSHSDFDTNCYSN